MPRTTAVKNLMVKTSNLTEARILTDSDAGRTFFLNSASGFEVTLPAPRGGVSFEFFVKTAPTTADYVIAAKADANICLGQVVTSDTNSAVDTERTFNGVSNIRFKANHANIGDSLELISDGTYWYVEGFSSLYDGIAIVNESKSPSTSPSTSPSSSPSASASTSPSASSSISPSTSPSASASTSPSASSSISPSTSPSASASTSPSASSSISPSTSPSASASTSPSASSSISPSTSPSASSSISPSVSPSISLSVSSSVSISSSPSASSSLSPSASSSISPSSST